MATRRRDGGRSETADVCFGPGRDRRGEARPAQRIFSAKRGRKRAGAAGRRPSPRPRTSACALSRVSDVKTGSPSNTKSSRDRALCRRARSEDTVMARASVSPFRWFAHEPSRFLSSVRVRARPAPRSTGSVARARPRGTVALAGRGRLAPALVAKVRRKLATLHSTKDRALSHGADADARRPLVDARSLGSRSTLALEIGREDPRPRRVSGCRVRRV